MPQAGRPCTADELRPPGKNGVGEPAIWSFLTASPPSDGNPEK